jgi:L-malate glycosyltransferase
VKKKVMHQFVHTLNYGDAISCEVLSLKRCFENLGYQSEIYAINIHQKYKNIGKVYTECQSTEEDYVILHYSLGSILNDLYKTLPCKKRILIYHNITPAFYFKAINPRVASDIESGIQELPGLCALSDMLIADSSFNARDLKEYGFDSVGLDLPVDTARWDNEPSNEGIKALLNNDQSLHLLHVGRIAPNKKLEDILKVFYFLHHHIFKNSKLWFVGIDIDTEVYSYALKRMADELSLRDNVIFTGGLSDSEVRAFYENASVYICMSEHEGFCLPVVEAMHFQLPVVCYAAGAIPETVDAGAILLNEKRYSEIAELVCKLYTDKSLRDLLITQGTKRVMELQFNAFQDRVKEIFTALE